MEGELRSPIERSVIHGNSIYTSQYHLTFTCNSLSRTKQITTNQLRSKARELYKNDDGVAESSSDVPLSADDINEQRSIPQWNNGDSYDDGSAWTGYEADPYID